MIFHIFKIALESFSNEAFKQYRYSGYSMMQFYTPLRISIQQEHKVFNVREVTEIAEYICGSVSIAFGYKRPDPDEGMHHT